MRGSAASKGVKCLIVGGGAGGLGIASKLARNIPNASVSIVEPNELHYYQPGFTLVASGLMTVKANSARQDTLTPAGARLVKDSVQKFIPHSNKVVLRSGAEMEYDIMVIATGLKIRLDKIAGAAEAVKDASCPVSTAYLPHGAAKTYQYLSTLNSGQFLFTFPSTPIKCAGAPQKVCYLADDILRGRGVRDECSLHYCTTLPRIFGVEKYATALMKIINDRGINLHLRTNLVEVDGKNRVATFENCDKPGEFIQRKFDFLHIGPPCSPVEAVHECSTLSDPNGWLDVHPKTLQSKTHTNVFGVGDCVNTPNAKTAAAISSQLKCLEVNISDALSGRPLSAEYDGYASCPLLVSRKAVILAEFNSAGPMETTPFNQARPTYFAFLLKRFFMPWLYWKALIKGHWNGPATLRKLFHLGFIKRQ